MNNTSVPLCHATPFNDQEIQCPVSPNVIILQLIPRHWGGGVGISNHTKARFKQLSCLIGKIFRQASVQTKAEAFCYDIEILSILSQKGQTFFIPICSTQSKGFVLSTYLSGSTWLPGLLKLQESALLLYRY